MRQRETWKERHGESQEDKKNLKDNEGERRSLSGTKSSFPAGPRPAPEKSTDVPDTSGQVLEWWL